MTHDPLIRKTLAPDVIDLCVGEAHLIRKALVETFPLELFTLRDVDVHCDYQQPEGYPPLVELLEARHGAPVVITSGAKQGLAACFYAAKCMGVTGVTMRAPYWSQMPAAVEIMGLTPVFDDEPERGCAHLLVSPNNPDGYITSPEHARLMRSRCAAFGVPLIHDAAYHTPTYTNDAVRTDPLPELSDTSVWSAAKMYGLSGLRVGWVACKDPAFKQHVCEYVEATTVGVSLLSQKVIHHIITYDARASQARERFHQRARNLLANARATVAGIDPGVLDTSGVTQSNGMFGWFKVGPKFDADRARIHVAPGVAFGYPDRVRLNIAVEPELLREAVKRLNALR
jgi:aspartate/methionine/tyrosine aminotransferase